MISPLKGLYSPFKRPYTPPHCPIPEPLHPAPEPIFHVESEFEDENMQILQPGSNLNGL